jgi:hypothetical protein
MEKRTGIITTGENSRFVHQSSMAILPEESTSSKSEELGEGSDEFGLRNIFVHG